MILKTDKHAFDDIIDFKKISAEEMPWSCHYYDSLLIY